MKDKFKLVGITILFVLTGLVLSFFAIKDSDLIISDSCLVDNMKYSIGEEILGYKDGAKCFCREDGLVECAFIESEQIELDTAGLEKEGLDFDYKYLRGIVHGESSFILDSVNFTDVSFVDGKLSVVLEQIQLCPTQNTPPEQVGFFEFSDVDLKLYNMVRPTEGPEGLNCVVQLKYIFSDIEGLGETRVSFVDENGFVTYALVCPYNGKLYSDSDVFRNLEGEICTCVEGEIDCEVLPD